MMFSSTTSSNPCATNYWENDGFKGGIGCGKGMSHFLLRLSNETSLGVGSYRGPKKYF